MRGRIIVAPLMDFSNSAEPAELSFERYVATRSSPLAAVRCTTCQNDCAVVVRMRLGGIVNELSIAGKPLLAFGDMSDRLRFTLQNHMAGQVQGSILMSGARVL